MSSLPYDALYARVFDAVRNATGGLSARDDVERIVQVARAAVTDAAEVWNASSSPLARQLPPELLAGCFSWLDVTARVRAACTSRAWRAVALSHPAGWSDLDFRVIHLSVSKLDSSFIACLIQRSGGLPVDLRIPRLPINADTNGLDTLIQNHLHRLRVLNFEQRTLLRLTGLHAPMLEEIDAACDVDLPCAPLLRRVSVHCFHIDEAAQRFVHLTSFAGHMHHPSDARRLFQLCPNLVALSLSFITASNVHLLPTLPAPLSLADVILETFGPPADRLRDYLQMWHGCPLRSLAVTGEQYLEPSLELFGRVDSAVQRLCWSNGDFHFEMTDKANLYVSYDTWRSSVFSLMDAMSRIQPYLGGLICLELNDESLLLALISASVSLPALERMTLRDSTLPIPAYGRLHAPLLRIVAVHFSDVDDGGLAQFVVRMPELWNGHFGPEGSRLESVLLHDLPASRAQGVDLRPLLQCSSSVFLDANLGCVGGTRQVY